MSYAVSKEGFLCEMGGLINFLKYRINSTLSLSWQQVASCLTGFVNMESSLKKMPPRPSCRCLMQSIIFMSGI